MSSTGWLLLAVFFVYWPLWERGELVNNRSQVRITPLLDDEIPFVKFLEFCKTGKRTAQLVAIVKQKYVPK